MRKSCSGAEHESRIILTFDRDYGEPIFRQRLGRPSGIVYFRYAPDSPYEPGEHLLRLLAIPGLELPSNSPSPTASACDSDRSNAINYSGGFHVAKSGWGKHGTRMTRIGAELKEKNGQWSMPPGSILR